MTVSIFNSAVKIVCEETLGFTRFLGVVGQNKPLNISDHK